ncbi:MAG: prepilin peptidase [Kiritimatiellae bacterium]|nr:prepilin peptidase [Kiritimatiellia bacterium]
MALYYFIVFALFAFSLGACVASFLNVCIWRLPREESVVSPPSHCPKCNAPIRWYQNIPIISWCCLRGRCANCRQPISPRYMVVEILGGVFFLLAYMQWAMPTILGYLPPFGMVRLFDPWMMAVEALAITGLILGSFIDLDHFYLPDRVTIGGMVLGVPLSFLVPEMQGQPDRIGALCWSVGGMAGGFLFLWAVGAVFSRLFRKEALGFGDVKLIGAVGAFFGPWAVLFTIIMSSVVGSVAGIALVVRGRAKLGGFTAVPYGPFLALGALVWMYWGPAIFDWYLRLLRLNG